MDEDAVSPVVGVILMVAVAVVLAGVMFVLVSDPASDDVKRSPLIVMDRDEGKDRWIITSGGSEAQDRFAIRGEAPGVKYTWNATADSSSPSMPTTATKMVGSTPWDAGAFLSLCGESGPVHDYTVTFVDLANNRIVTETTFTLIDPCL